MADIKKFTASRDANRTKGVPFELEWYDDDDVEHVETFVCYPNKVPGALRFDLLIDDESEPMWDFFRAALSDPNVKVVDEETRILAAKPFEEFRTFIRDERHNIDSGVIVEAIRWMNSRDAGRPTTPSTP